MSTITDRIVRGAALVALVLGTWMLIMLAIPFLGPVGRQVAVIGDGRTAAHAILAAGGSIVEIRRGAILARSPSPGFTASLYRNGAPLVLESRIAAGCFGQIPGRWSGYSNTIR